MAITADDYNALTTALSGICFALTRRLPVAERQPLLQDLVAMAHARNTAGDLRGETLLLDLAAAVASAMAGDPLKEKKALPRVCPGTREGQSRARGDDDALREEMGMQRMDTVKRLLRRARAGSAAVLAPAWRSSRRGAARYGRRGL
mgnify:FL=1